MRALGLNIDILPPDTSDLSAYDLVLIPGLATLSDNLIKSIAAYQGTILAGPRTNSKTPEMAIPVPLPPNLPGLDATVVRVESLPPGINVALETGGQFIRWFERLDTNAATTRTADGHPAIASAGNLHYLAGWPHPDTFHTLLSDLCAKANIATTDLPDGLRQRDTATHRFLFNYAPEAITFNGTEIPPAGVHWTPL